MENIANVFQSAPAQIITVVRESIYQGADALMDVTPSLTNALSDIFVKKCIEVCFSVLLCVSREQVNQDNNSDQNFIYRRNIALGICDRS
jgi:membrane protein CcdC involved in cytochrome C biogenesis